MANDKLTAEARRQATRIHRSLGEEVARLRADAGLSAGQLGDAAGVDLAFLLRIEEGRARPSVDTLTKLTVALGADLSARIYPTTGPTIHDRHQARILEALIEFLHPRWNLYPEVAVRSPARGFIDAVLHAARERQIIATEIETDLRRLEQHMSWFQEKAASLPSWEGWPHLGEIETTSRLLIVRSTRATRAVARDFQRQLMTFYPAHPADAITALTGGAPWPGAAIVGAHIESGRVRFIGRR